MSTYVESGDGIVCGDCLHFCTPERPRQCDREHCTCPDNHGDALARVLTAERFGPVVELRREGARAA